jgi:subtilisin family serine protease
VNKLTRIAVTTAVIFSSFSFSSDFVEAKANNNNSVKKTSVKKPKKKVSTISYNKVKSNRHKVTKARTRVKFNFSLDQSIAKISANIPYDLNYKGQDTFVVVIDTGVEKAHPFLKDKVALEACFSDQCPNGQTEMIGDGAAAPVHWHGTHVAGIIAGSNQFIHGVAPSAKIIAINVFDPLGGAYDSDIIKALQWVHSIADRYNIAAVNMSLGSSAIFRNTCDTYIPAMTTAIANLKNKNIATVVSAGNSYALGMSSPACISHSVSVAATSTWSDKVTSFSNVSEYTTLSAPGLTIQSSKLMSSYGAASGTSMAAPHVAGAFAVYRSKFGVQPVTKVVTDFQSTAAPALDDYTNITTKRIDFKSLFSDSSTPSPTTTVPSTTIAPSPTTTIPVTTTTVPVVTTTTVPAVTTTTTPVRNFVSEPYINRALAFNALTVGVTIRYYSLNSLRASSIIIQCSNTGLSDSPVIFTTSFDYTSGNLLNYSFQADLTMVKYCRAIAKASNGTESTPSDYVFISKP